jgi:8-oxo-dGTP diphosphatase
MQLDKGCGGVIVRGNEVLLMLRNASTFHEYWANPGGRLEEGETAEEGTVREIKEELGVDVRIVREISVYDHYVEGALFGKYAGFLVSVVSGEPRIVEPEKCAALEWFSVSALPKKITPYTLQYIKDLFPEAECVE